MFVKVISNKCRLCLNWTHSFLKLTMYTYILLFYFYFFMYEKYWHYYITKLSNFWTIQMADNSLFGKYELSRRTGQLSRHEQMEEREIWILILVNSIWISDASTFSIWFQLRTARWIKSNDQNIRIWTDCIKIQHRELVIDPDNW